MNENMANKRRLLVEKGELEENPKELYYSDRDLSLEASWKEWSVRVYLKYLYILGFLFLACMVPLELMNYLQGSVSYAAAFLSLLVIVPISIVIYGRLWGEEGIWGRKKPLRR